jgi:hypothetical protein
MPSPDNCGRCGEPNDEHTPGQRCPVDNIPHPDGFPGSDYEDVNDRTPIVVDTIGCQHCFLNPDKCDHPTEAPKEVIPPARGICQICKYEGLWAHIQATGCPHKEGPGSKANAIHLIAANRRRGRPPGSKSGSGYEEAQRRQQVKINRVTRKLVVEKIVGKGIAHLDQQLSPRIPNRPNVPERTIGELKDSALKLLSQQLWNLEGVAEDSGLTEDEEARLLKLLAGFNAALPKAAEKAPGKELSEMTDEELEAASRGNK